MKLLAIDPGPVESAWLTYSLATRLPARWAKVANDELLALLNEALDSDVLAIEMVASYGMPVGADVFETCVWAGRFIERWLLGAAGLRDEPVRVFRRDVKLHVCSSARANDSNIRQALIDRYGGKAIGVGRKACQGPLYGLSGDCWAALGVAVTAAETRLTDAWAA